MTSLGSNGIGTGTGLSMTLDGTSTSSTKQPTHAFTRKEIKGGLFLVYDAEQTVQNDDGEIVTVMKAMEEHRSVCDRYSNVMTACWERRKRELQDQKSSAVVVE